MELLLFWVVMVIISTVIGNKRGQTALGFLLGFALGPLGVLLVLVIPAANRKACPFCCELIHKDAVKCPRCQSDLSQVGGPSILASGPPVLREVARVTPKRFIDRFLPHEMRKR